MSRIGTRLVKTGSLSHSFPASLQTSRQRRASCVLSSPSLPSFSRLTLPFISDALGIHNPLSPASVASPVAVVMASLDHAQPFVPQFICIKSSQPVSLDPRPEQGIQGSSAALNFNLSHSLNDVGREDESSRDADSQDRMSEGFPF